MKLDIGCMGKNGWTSFVGRHEEKRSLCRKNRQLETGIDLLDFIVHFYHVQSDMSALSVSVLLNNLYRPAYTLTTSRRYISNTRKKPSTVAFNSAILVSNSFHSCRLVQPDYIKIYIYYCQSRSSSIVMSWYLRDNMGA